MGDLKLFQIGNDRVVELPGMSVAVEKSLQSLLEAHLEDFLGVRFMASEYSTGKTHGGRIDTLGIDENNTPVIIEYKRSLNENVINQGLFYLDWLLDHRAEFELLVLNKFGREVSDKIEWFPRLLCIAGDFSKYDVHAVQQINRNIELLRYKRYGADLLLLELINATTQSSPNSIQATHQSPISTKEKKTDKRTDGTALDQVEKASVEVRDRYEALKAFLLALGDDVQIKPLQYYIAFRRLKNFVTLYVFPQNGTIKCWVRLDPETITLDGEFMRDVRNTGHWGQGDLEITIRNSVDLEQAKPFFQLSYDQN